MDCVDQQPQRKRRSEHNKMFLQPNFKKSKVSSTTNWRFSKISKGCQPADSTIRVQQNDYCLESLSTIQQPQDSNDDCNPGDELLMCSTSSFIGSSVGDVEQLQGIQETLDDTSLQHATSSFHYSGDDERSESSDSSQGAYNAQNEVSRNAAEAMTFERKKTDNTVMFPQSGLTVHEVGANITALSLRHHLTYEATTDISNFIKLLSGDTFNYESLFNKYYMQMHYNCDKSAILKYHFYCEKCEKKVLHETSKDTMLPIRVVCHGCDFEQDVSFKKLNYFISIDLKYQFSHMLQSPKIRKKIIDASNIAKQKARLDDAPMSSASHGDLYKNLPTDDTRHIVAVNGNTDGAPVAENSVLSMWPVTVRVNELSTPESASHTIVSGMMVVDHEPSPDLLNLYLEVVLVDNIEPLGGDGLVIEDGDEKSEFLVFVTQMNLDSKARAAVQKRKQYNARHGCSWCYAEGVSIGGCVRFPLSHTFAGIRTKSSHVKDVKTALETQKICRGVTGPCSIMKLRHFDPVWGCTFDDLHGGYLGQTKQHWKCWTKTSCPCYIAPSEVMKINKIISKTEFPSDIERDFRPFKRRVKHKGSEWRSWLLFLSPICLKDIIPDEYLENYCLLVKSFYLMSQDEVCDEECLTCQEDLDEYIGGCEILYGQEYMNFNPHSASHIALSVRKGGPLWGSSTFPPESFMYQLQLNKTSPKGVSKQIVSRYLQSNHLRWTIHPNLDPNSRSTPFLESVMYKNHYARNGLNNLQLTSPKILDEGIVYNRCIHAGVIYTSIDYSKNVKKNDCVVQLDDDCIAQILHFFLKEGVCFLKVQKIASTKVKIGKVELPHIHRLHCLYDHIYTIKITKIKKKCVLMHVNDGGRYIATLPNQLNNA